MTKSPPRRTCLGCRRVRPQAELIRLTVALGVVTLDWITADEEYGRNGESLDALEALEPR